MMDLIGAFVVGIAAIFVFYMLVAWVATGNPLMGLR